MKFCLERQFTVQDLARFPDSPVLTRELLYTGITRAKNHVDLWVGEEALLAAAIGRKVERHSGLYAALWGEGWRGGLVYL